MKLERILERLNSLEKGQFLKIINNLSAEEKDNPQLEAILSRADSNLKNADAIQVKQAFDALSNRYVEFVMEDYSKVPSDPEFADAESVPVQPVYQPEPAPVPVQTVGNPAPKVIGPVNYQNTSSNPYSEPDRASHNPYENHDKVFRPRNKESH